MSATRSTTAADVQGVMFERHRAGSGRIAFALRHPLAARFEHVDHPREAYDLVAAWLREARDAPDT